MTERPPPSRIPAAATPERLEEAALRYLENYSATATTLRRVLTRRLLRSERAHGTDPEIGRGWIEAIIAKLQRLSLLDDSAFAETRSVRLHRRGASAKMIAADLAQKGVERELIDRVLESAREAGGDLKAAASHARRRRLGAFRSRPLADDTHFRELSSFARAGFSRIVAEEILAADRDRLDDILTRTT